MSRPTKVSIDLNALRNNLDYVRTLTKSKIVAVVKANAYGHNVEPIAKVLEAENVDQMAVVSVDEAMEIRQLGIKASIILLSGFYSADDLPIIEKYNLKTVIEHPIQLELFLSYKTSKPWDIWLKFDSGLHRAGFLHDDYLEAFERLKNSSNVRNIVHMTHFSSADDPGNSYTNYQIQAFDKTTNELGGERSLSNSSGIMAWPNIKEDWVRPGLMLYGATPIKGRTFDPALQPVMKVTSEIVSIRHLPKGSAIGYSGSCVLEEDTKIGLIPMGYADGYPREVRLGAYVLINGAIADVLGRVSMDWLTVNLNNIPEVRVGDVVIIWGGGGLTVEKVAAQANTIPYQVLCNVKRISFDCYDRQKSEMYLQKRQFVKVSS